MKCELCHKGDAQVAITLTVNGKSKELYVCKACAEKNKAQVQVPGKKKPSAHPGHPQLSVMGKSADDLPQPLVDGLVKATIDFMKGVAEVEENEHRVCPVCKSNWEKIKNSGRIPCPSCWKTFAKQIRNEFLTGEYALNHVGSAPAVSKLSNVESVRAVLERELKDAIAREDYHAAANLKKKLDALDAEKENPA